MAGRGGATRRPGYAVDGVLDARAHEITTEMLLKAADAIAHVVKDDELNANFIIPSVFNPDVPKAVAAAIRGADA